MCIRLIIVLGNHNNVCANNVLNGCKSIIVMGKQEKIVRVVFLFNAHLISRKHMHPVFDEHVLVFVWVFDCVLCVGVQCLPGPIFIYLYLAKVLEL